MKIYQVYAYQAYESENDLGHFLYKEKAQKKMDRLVKIQKNFQLKVLWYDGLPAEVQEFTDYPVMPRQYQYGTIAIAEINVIE